MTHLLSVVQARDLGQRMASEYVERAFPQIKPEARQDKSLVFELQRAALASALERLNRNTVYAKAMCSYSFREAFETAFIDIFPEIWAELVNRERLARKWQQKSAADHQHKLATQTWAKERHDDDLSELLNV